MSNVTISTIRERKKASAFVMYQDGTIGSVSVENEARHLAGRPQLLSISKPRPESRKEVVNG